ncbi:MAG: DUF58 domain-containing protein [Planctomycetia bacterium]|nr:DUF58 domain-containing protein [Planctomycetia bacterium]
MKRETQPANSARLRLTNSGVLWLFVAIGVGALAWYKSINLVLLVVYAMVALLILNGFIAWVSVRRTRAARIAMPPVFAGERVETGVTVTNSSSHPATVTVEDRVGGQSIMFLAYRVPGRTTIACTTSRLYPARGRFTAPVILSSAFPFGFLNCERPCESGEIIVLPRLGVVDPGGLRRWMMRQSGGDGRSRRVLRRVTTDHADVRGVRPYRPGDPIRAIHWRTSARRGELMVREYDLAPSPELVLVVEPWVPTTPTERDCEQLEAALSLAATIAITWRRAFDSVVTLIVLGAGSTVVPMVGTATSEESLRDFLAPLADTAGVTVTELPSPGAFTQHIAVGARLVVSSRPNSPTATALTRSTGKPFVAISPVERVAWYQPPKPEDKLR